MRASELRKLGFPDGPMIRKAQKTCGKLMGAESGPKDKSHLKGLMCQVAGDPEDWTNSVHDCVSELARELIEWREKGPREEPVNYEVWGTDIDPAALEQIENACKLPVAHKGAVMPDAHLGYGLPVGGVLATEGAIVPWAVGVDIACRMRLSVVDLGRKDFWDLEDDLRLSLQEETAFGMGAEFDQSERRDHEVLEDDDWSISQIVSGQRDKAWRQLGSSGSGNHFAEWGFVYLKDQDNLDVEPGIYLALLTHSGSRGPGATVSSHYADIAEERHPELPDPIRKLSWLELDSPEGQEYLRAMRLMGRFAEACHETMHDAVIGALGDVEVLEVIENHHNFAWTDTIDGREMVVHRKGATPAHDGELGVIPGTMTDPAYLVKGKGDPTSLYSASHGAGRRMSRSQAKRELTDEDTERELEEARVELLSAGLDESPLAYKDIDEVMGHQQDLVETIGSFQPRIVKMAPPSEPFWYDDV